MQPIRIFAYCTGMILGGLILYTVHGSRCKLSHAVEDILTCRLRLTEASKLTVDSRRRQVD